MKLERSDFIAAMRHVANSVSVVTTAGKAGRHGATVSAFCSVSADPPTALVCLHAKSRIADLVLKNRKFNILAADNRHFAERFAGMHDRHVSDRFDGIDIDQQAVPELPGATVLGCVIDQSIHSGSHQVVIGTVQSVINGRNHPLTYLDGAYHQVLPLNCEIAEGTSV